MCIVQCDCARTLLSYIAQTGQFVIFEYDFESDRPPPSPDLGNQNERSTESVDRSENLGWSMRFLFLDS